MHRSSTWIDVALLLTSSTLASSTHSETRQVFCHLQMKSPVIKKTRKLPVTDQRANKEEGGIKFSTPVLTLKVFWADPGTNHRF